MHSKKVLLWLIPITTLMLVILVFSAEALTRSHSDQTIQYLSSDGATYLALYEQAFADVELLESPALFLIGSPILFMKLANGNLLSVLIFNLLVTVLTMKAALECLPRPSSKMWFLFGAFMFPYFALGFLSLNKEIYAMCSAIFFAVYLVRGRWSDAFFALALAACARYYMLISIVLMFGLVPRNCEPRYGLIAGLLIFISVFGPIAKALVPEYSSDEVLEGAGFTGVIFSNVINFYGYAVIYPVKYLVLIPQRAYGFLIGSERETDAMEGIVSIVTIIVVVLVFRVLLSKRPLSPVGRKLFVTGMIAPMPMMWSDIMHWRYYSFVYFFFLIALVLHRADSAKTGKFIANRVPA